MPFKVEDHVEWNPEPEHDSVKNIRLYHGCFDPPSHTNLAKKDEAQFAIKSNPSDSIVIYSSAVS